jgi:diguanylate cyclase (GGDEF)-like protein
VSEVQTKIVFKTGFVSGSTHTEDFATETDVVPFDHALVQPDERTSEAARSESGDERRVFLSKASESRREIQFALAAVAVSAAVFAVTAPFAKIQLAHVTAFIPAYQSALCVCDLITAVLLFGQFNVLRSPSLLVLASGYLFAAFIVVPLTLTYPDVFSPTGLLGAGPQSAAWLYMFWHIGFPLFVMVYALLKGDQRSATRTGGSETAPLGRDGHFVLAAVAAVLALVCGLTLLTTAFHDSLPMLMLGIHLSSAMRGVIVGIWSLSLIALGVLGWRRPHSVLDMWLMVVMCAWLFDMGLGAVFNTGRFDLGFYAGRMYGLLAATFLLIVLLIETGAHYSRLAQLSAQLGVANKALERMTRHDGLTKLANRRFFDIYLAFQISIARRHKRPVALVMCDIDAFKAFNDHYGHQAGDECLKRVADALQFSCRRDGDMVARYGGEEFTIILPDTDLIGAGHIAEAARDAVARLRIPHEYSPTAPHVSISGGVSVLLHRTEFSAERLIAAADEMLYQAKRLGRNRIVSAQAELGVENPSSPATAHSTRT